MHPTSVDTRVDGSGAPEPVPDPGELPLGLGFVDRKLEAEWWRQYAKERQRLLRGNIGLLYGIWVTFWPVDVFVFREHTRALLTARSVLLALLAVTAPLVFGKRSSEMLQRHAQEILLYLTVVSTGALFAMAWFVLGTTDETEVIVALAAGLFTLVCIYCTSGLRFAYATPVGTVGAIVFFFMMRARAHPSLELTIVAVAFLVGESVVCAVICHTLEAMGRRDFLRRRELEGAHARTERLLLNLMPRSLAERLKTGSGAMLDRLPEATVLFATLVGFEDATRSLPPLDAVRLLDKVVASFDRAALSLGVERIKTVGATYMAAAGVPEAQVDHAARAARLSLAMREIVRQLAGDLGPGVSLRAGLASGAVVAGVIGKSRIAFDCWGDTANLASRLDSHGKPDRIQLAPATALALAPGFVVLPMGTILLKGKGEVAVAFLEGGQVKVDLSDIHPITLSFRDPAVEREFWLSSARTRRKSMQVGTVVLGVLFAAFGVVDSYVFGSGFPALAWLRYAVCVPLLLLAWPLVFLPSLRGVMERRAQEILLYQGVVATGGILTMGALQARHESLVQVMIGSLGMLVTLTFLYGFTYLRFLYSAALGIVATLTGLVVLLLSLVAPASIWVTVSLYGIAVNVGGFWLGRTLEALVRRDFARQRAIEEEKERSERLLANALPAEIARRLRDDDVRIESETAALAERHAEVTVLVADIVGFTPLAEKLAPDALAALLDRLFSAFDELCSLHGVEKIKTLGDAWIAAAGVPTARPDHALRTARLALDMLVALEQVRAAAPSPIAMRIGIETGTAVAGVIGRTRFAYDLWGEAVDGAKAMEHGGAPGRVRLGAATYARLRGLVKVESMPDAHGEVAHWLVGA